jgi:hypothetical protein
MSRATWENRLTLPSFSELSEEEKDRVIELILARMGCSIEAYKLDGEDRIIQLGVHQPS